MLIVDRLMNRIAYGKLEDLKAAFVPDWRRWNKEDVRAFLLRCRSDPIALEQALRRELASHPAYAPPADIEILCNVATRGIVTMRIMVGALLDKRPNILFDDLRPVAHLWGAVLFPSLKIASSLIASFPENSREARDYEQALRHKAGDTWRRRSTAGPQDGAAYVADGRLMLLPFGGNNTLRWAWRRHGVAGESVPVKKVALSPPRLRAPIPPTTSLVPLSVLPDPPTILGAQANAMIVAARLASPFCEECARDAGRN